MSFIKRIVSIDRFCAYYVEDNLEGIGQAIGKADCFIVKDAESREILRYWQSGDKQAARKLVEDYVLRISSPTSSNN